MRHAVASLIAAGYRSTFLSLEDNIPQSDLSMRAREKQRSSAIWRGVLWEWAHWWWPVQEAIQRSPRSERLTNEGALQRLPLEQLRLSSHHKALSQLTLSLCNATFETWDGEQGCCWSCKSSTSASVVAGHRSQRSQQGPEVGFGRDSRHNQPRKDTPQGSADELHSPPRTFSHSRSNPTGSRLKGLDQRW